MFEPHLTLSIVFILVYIVDLVWTYIDHKGLEPVPGTLGRGKTPEIRWESITPKKNIYFYTIQFQFMFLGAGRKLENMEEAHMDMVRTCETLHIREPGILSQFYFLLMRKTRSLYTCTLPFPKTYGKKFSFRDAFKGPCGG